MRARLILTGSGRSGTVVAASALLVGAMLAACASGPGASPSISGAWIRPSTGMDMPAAAYFTITNHGGDDALLRVSSPVASAVEIHETSTDANGMTGMSPVARVDVKAGATLTLAPGGLHLMLMGLNKAIVTGDTIELDLEFEHAGRIVVQAVARSA